MISVCIVLSGVRLEEENLWDHSSLYSRCSAVVTCKFLVQHDSIVSHVLSSMHSAGYNNAVLSAFKKCVIIARFFNERHYVMQLNHHQKLE